MSVTGAAGATGADAVDRPVQAAAMIVGAMVVLGVVDACVRFFADALTLWEFHLIRAALAVPMLALAARGMAAGGLRPRRIGPVAARSALIVCAMVLLFAALPVLPMAQVSAGFMTSPFFVLLFSALFLGEPVGPRRIGAVIVGFVGAMLIIEPFGGAPDPMVFAPILGGAFYAASLIVTRKSCRDEPPMALVMASFIAFGVMAVIGTAVLAALEPPAALVAAAPFVFGPTRLFEVAPPLEIWLGMAAMAVGSAVAILGLTRAYQLAEASFLALFDYTYVIAGIFAAFVLWGQTPSAQSWLGATLIILAGAYLARRNAQSAAEALTPPRARPSA